MIFLIGKKIKFEDSDDVDSAGPENDDDDSEDDSDTNMNTLKGTTVGLVFTLLLLIPHHITWY